jgi:4-hydroxybenzoate polyprenyltransferase
LPRSASAAAIGVLLYVAFLRRGFAPRSAIGASLPFVLAAAAGGMLNDYHDRRRDALDKPWRAIPAGYVRPRLVLTVAALMILVAGMGSLVADYSTTQRATAWVALAAVSCYHLVVRRAPALKAPYIGVLSALPVACVLDGTAVPSLGPWVATATFVCGRELLMDVLDIAGDAETGSRTIAVRLGATAGGVLGFTLVIAGVAIFQMSTRHVMGASGRAVILTAVLAASLTLWVLLPSRRRFVIYLMWIPLVVGVSALLLPLGLTRGR